MTEPKGKEPRDEIETDVEDKSEEEKEKEYKEVRDRTVKDLFAESDDEIDRNQDAVDELLEYLDYLTASDVKMDELNATRRDLRRDGMELPREPGSKMQGVEDAAAQLRSDVIGTTPRDKGPLYTRAKGITFLIGILVAGNIVAGTIIAAITLAHQMNGDPAPATPLPLTDAEKQALKDQIQRWWNLPDDQFWDQMAQYCDRWNPSLEGQVLMMDTIKQLAQAVKPAWVWASNTAQQDDKWTAIEKVMNAYADFNKVPVGQSKSRALYTTIKAYTYTAVPNQGPALPRMIAADIVELAVSQILLIPKVNITAGVTDSIATAGGPA